MLMKYILIFGGLLSLTSMYRPPLSLASIEYLKFLNGLYRGLEDLILEEYLEYRNFFTLHRNDIAGYVTATQKFQMNEVLAAHPNIKTIGEIGLNAGHSADNFFGHCNQLERFVSFDIKCYPEVLDYFAEKYKDRFHFVVGDSLETVPEFAERFPDVKFDLIFIDGAHSFDNCYHDILNMKQLAHSNTCLWIDDYKCPEVFEAVEVCKNMHGILEVIKVHSSDLRTAAERCWVEARYLFPEAVEK
jgi:spermidine synthase